MAAHEMPEVQTNNKRILQFRLVTRYLQNEMNLKELVVCKFDGCNKVYNDPRFLPCGKRTCADHIEEMTMKHDGVSSDRKIKCHFCHKIHTYSNEDGKGFQVDENISALLNMKYCDEHEAAKKSFNDVSQFLKKLSDLDAEAYAIEKFERVEADIVLEKDMQRLVAYYQKLVDEVHERKVNCLQKLKTSKTVASQLEPINQALNEFDSKLKKDNLEFTLKTLDGDDDKWREIQMECDTMMERIKAFDDQLTEIILSDEVIGFRPCSRRTVLEDIFGILDLPNFDSLIINNYQLDNTMISLCSRLCDTNSFELLYRASRDGFEAAAFHAKCDNQPKTLTVIRTTKGFIFGAYTSVAWDSTSGFKDDPYAFIYSLVNSVTRPRLFRVKAGGKYAICCRAELGPTFGRGCDIMIWSNSNASTESYSNLGLSYDFTLYECGRVKAQSFLAGARNFQTSEIEVFSCNSIE